MPSQTAGVGSARYAVLDAARDYLTVGLARTVCEHHANLFAGPRARALEHVAPHLFRSDPHAILWEVALAPKPAYVGILIEAPLTLDELRAHLRRFLTVRRQRDGRAVYFRYYDPRILVPFLPSCTPDELAAFFGPIHAFHCQADYPSQVRSFWLSEGTLATADTSTSGFIARVRT